MLSNGRRTMDGFGDFLNRHYLKRRGTGRFKSTLSYLAYMSTFLGATSQCELKFHTLPKLDIIKLKFKFNDLFSRALKANHVSDINSAVEAYVDYIRFCDGIYTPSVKVAA